MLHEQHQSFEEFLLPEQDMMQYIPGEDRKSAEDLFAELNTQFDTIFAQEGEDSPSYVAQHMEQASERFTLC